MFYPHRSAPHNPATAAGASCDDEAVSSSTSGSPPVRRDAPSSGPARTLGTAPQAFLDPSTDVPSFGAYEGKLPPFDLARASLRDRILRNKRWVYVAIAAPDVWLSVAIVRTGYAATAFVFVYDLQGKRMLVDRSALGPAFVSKVSADLHAPGEIASFALGGARLALTRRGHTLDLAVRFGDLEIDAMIDEQSGPPAISAIADLGAGLVNGTEKRALLAVRGSARSGSREIGLDGGTAGYDYTHGLLPRHTKWRWAFGLGRDETGEPFGFNLVEGFVGQSECAAFTAKGVVPVAEPRFDFDLEAPLRPWKLTAPGIDLAFEPGGMHAERTNLVVVRSRFVQPVGTFTGTVRAGGRDVRIAGLPGVVEDQDVVW